MHVMPAPESTVASEVFVEAAEEMGLHFGDYNGRKQDEEVVFSGKTFTVITAHLEQQPAECSLNSQYELFKNVVVKHTQYSEVAVLKNMQTHLCVWLSLKMQVYRCNLLFLVLHLSVCLPLSPSSVFTPRPDFFLNTLIYFHPSLAHWLAPSATPCSSSCLSRMAGASLHHWPFSFRPSSAPLVNQPVTMSASCPQCSSQQQKLPPTP